MTTHDQKILDQFTRQASLFQSSHRSAESAIAAALEVSAVSGSDEVLDVACGPGVLACAFASVAKHVTGIDITPQMLNQAAQLQATAGVGNVTWKSGSVYDMPFEAGSFSMLITRYAFHHLERPRDVLREMVRVCRPGGVLVIIDSAPPPDKAARFNDIEKRRDPSHTKALTQDELTGMVVGEGLSIEKRHLYAWEVSAESLLARSFPADDDRQAVRKVYEADVGVNALGMSSRFIDGVLHVTFPTLITVARKGLDDSKQ